MGFAVTWHKMQRQNCESVIVDLNEMPFPPPIYFKSLYFIIKREKKL